MKSSFELRDEPEHSELVDKINRLANRYSKKEVIADRVLVLATANKNSEEYAETLPYYLEYYYGMSRKELLDYLGYLSETFDIKPSSRPAALPEDDENTGYWC